MKLTQVQCNETVILNGRTYIIRRNKSGYYLHEKKYKMSIEEKIDRLKWYIMSQRV
jgi:hypothetical protein